MSFIKWIIIGLLGIVGIITGVRFFRRTKSKVDDIIREIKAGDIEAQTTPKSLSDASSALLPRISRDFPEFDTAQMARRAEQDCTTYLESFYDRKNYFTERDGIRSFLEQMDTGIANMEGPVAWTSPRVHGGAISRYSNKENFCYVTYQVSYQYSYNGRTWQKKLEIVYLAADEPDMEKKISVYNCPNCGAPVGSIGQKVCKYCGTLINPAARLSWYIFDINNLA